MVLIPGAGNCCPEIVATFSYFRKYWTPNEVVELRDAVRSVVAVDA